MEASQEAIYQRFVDEMKYVDDVAQIILKGHLVMEDVMTQAICDFVHHGEFIEDTGLRFHQKVKICRAMSLSEHENGMWDLVVAINTLRNHLSHSLDPSKRQSKLDSLRTCFLREFPRLKNTKYEGVSDEATLCMHSISTCLGFLNQFHAEVKRFRELVVGMDQVMNKGVL
jgi:hypothetical protein